MDMPRPEDSGGAAALTDAEIMSIILGILLAMLLAALDQTIVATAMPTIGRELHDLDHLPWVVTAYLLASTAVTPLYGKVSDIYGRRITLMVGIATFVVGSVACALAPTMLALILARGLQGIGGGGLISLAQTIIADIVAPRERGRYQVYFASVFAASSLVGPVLGGYFAERLHWSVIFWINLPLGLLAFWMTNAKLRRLPRHERRHRLDIAGAVLMTAATVSLMLALNWGGLRYPWLSLPILSLVATSALLWVLFAARLLTAREPLIPLAVLRNNVVLAAMLSACFGMGTFIGLTIYVPIYFEVVLGLSARDSGLALVPLMLGTVTGATISGRAMAGQVHYKRLPMAGLGLGVAATATIAVLTTGLPFVLLEALLAATSLGLGMVLPVSTVSIQNAVEPHQLGTATASMNFFRQLGGAIIVAAFGALVLGGAGPHGGLTLETLSAGLSAHAAVTASFRWVFAAAALGLCLSLAALATMEERPLRGHAGPTPPTLE
jgi:EmrB/QacA subfamily drug resistance transporter